MACPQLDSKPSLPEVQAKAVPWTTPLHMRLHVVSTCLSPVTQVAPLSINPERPHRQHLLSHERKVAGSIPRRGWRTL